MRRLTEESASSVPTQTSDKSGVPARESAARRLSPPRRKQSE
ncbi:hypothetical protein FAGKG844_30207 [Frankia sp. AgKG'84/4]